MNDFGIEQIINSTANDETNNIFPSYFDENFCHCNCELYSTCMINKSFCPKRDIEEVLKTLMPREEKTIMLRYGIIDNKKHTLDEIANEFNVTKERIRQIEAKAIRKLRHPTRSKKLIFLYLAFGNSKAQCHKLLNKIFDSPDNIAVKPFFIRKALESGKSKQQIFLDLNTKIETLKIPIVEFELWKKMQCNTIYDILTAAHDKHKFYYNDNTVDIKYFYNTLSLLFNLGYEILNISLSEEKNLDYSKAYVKQLKPFTNEDLSTIDIDALELSVRSSVCLGRAGVTTIGDLLQYTDEKLMRVRNLGRKSYEEIIFKLTQLKFPLKNTCILECMNCGKAYMYSVNGENNSSFCSLCMALDEIANAKIEPISKENNSHNHCYICKKALNQQKDDVNNGICIDCKQKKHRIEKIKDITIEISLPEYSTYSISKSGFALYVNIKNNSNELKKIKLKDFTVFFENRARQADSFLNGYNFTDVVIMPETSKTVCKVWSVEATNQKRLANGDYVVFSIQDISEEREKMFKFVFTNDKWKLEDYYCI